MQELDDPAQQVTDPEALTVFLRRWNPAQMTLGPFQELTVNSKLKWLRNYVSRELIIFSISTANDEMKGLIATLSGIPEENIEFTKVR